MPIKWKKGTRFKPAIILKKIDSVRTVNSTGGVAFAGLELEENLPILQSMLDFPPAAAEIGTPSLVWNGLSQVGKDLTPDTFITAINKELNKCLATKECAYHLLTSLSLDPQGLPKRMRVLGAEIVLLSKDYPRRYKPREQHLQKHRLPTPSTPDSYGKVVIRAKAKSASAAFRKSMRSLDLLRALWCLMSNPRLQISFGTPSFNPINVIRLGSRHTLHYPNGTVANEGVWFEPGFVEASIYSFEKPEIAVKNTQWALRRITHSTYSDRIIASLLRFVRALDESDSNTAFVRLWGALEGLATPGQADYDKLVQRCSFLFKEFTYHGQVLEHLREYRNASLHAGDESENARTHCFQLQMYFVNLVWFHIRNATYFSSLDEANTYLESPPDSVALKRRRQLVQKAIRFRK